MSRSRARVVIAQRHPAALSLGAFVLAALVPSVFLAGDQYRIGVATLVVIFAIWASGWNIISGYAGQFSFGQGVFCGAGAYMSAALFVSSGVSPLIGSVVGGLVGAVLGVAIGVPAFRLRGPYFALTTLAFAEIVRLVVSSTDRIGPLELGGPEGINLPIGVTDSVTHLQFVDARVYYYIALGFLALVLAVTAWLARSKTGFYWGAIRTDEDAAASLGVPVLRYKLLAAALSAFICAMGGAMYAHYVGFVAPNRLFGLELSIQIALMGLVGGRATVFGPAVGAIVLYALGEFLRTYAGATSGAPGFVYGIILVLAIYYLPNGLVGVRWSRRGRRRLRGRAGVAASQRDAGEVVHASRSA